MNNAFHDKQSIRPSLRIQRFNGKSQLIRSAHKDGIGSSLITRLCEKRRNKTISLHSPFPRDNAVANEKHAL